LREIRVAPPVRPRGLETLLGPDVEAFQFKSIAFRIVLWQSRERFMKRFLMCALLLCLLLGLARQILVPAFGAAPRPGLAQPEVIASFHYAGLQQVNADTNGTVSKEIWNLPASGQLRDDVMNKLAAALAARFQAKTSGGSASCVGLIRPLLNDLSTAEWAAEVIERPQARYETVLALRLEENRSQVWQANLSQVVTGWEVRGGGLSYSLTNSWLAVRWSAEDADGASAAKTASVILGKLAKGQRPAGPAQGYWLKIDANLPRCGEGLGASEAKSWPRVELTVTGRKEYLRSQARLTFEEAPVTKLEKWQVPTGAIRDPLIHFSAYRGLSSWLSRQPLIQELGLGSVPNQLFVWGLSQTAFQIQAAVPVNNASSAFDQVAEKWVPKWNEVLAEYAVGNTRRLPDRAELIWRGLPILVPYLEPARDHGQDYLHAGIFPVNPPTNAPPAALFRQLEDEPNLLFYGWEITQSRLDQVRPLLQIGGIILTVSPMSTNSAASKWLDAIEPRLGNTVTEVTMNSPKEWNVLRTSHSGFNGLELLTLANWIEGTNFPHMNLNLRFRPVVRSSKQKQ
jgi:hypothetical protein